jgi:hypothetical protein
MTSIVRGSIIFLAISAAPALAVNCDLREYKVQAGLTAELVEDTLRVGWQGEREQELRAIFGIRAAQPVIVELAAKKSGGNWTVLGQNLQPEFEVTSARRRIPISNCSRCERWAVPSHQSSSTKRSGTHSGTRHWKYRAPRGRTRICHADPKRSAMTSRHIR